MIGGHAILVFVNGASYDLMTFPVLALLPVLEKIEAETCKSGIGIDSDIATA